MTPASETSKDLIVLSPYKKMCKNQNEAISFEKDGGTERRRGQADLSSEVDDSSLVIDHGEERSSLEIDPNGTDGSTEILGAEEQELPLPRLRERGNEPEVSDRSDGRLLESVEDGRGGLQRKKSVSVHLSSQSSRNRAHLSCSRSPRRPNPEAPVLPSSSDFLTVPTPADSPETLWAEGFQSDDRVGARGRSVPDGDGGCCCCEEKGGSGWMEGGRLDESRGRDGEEEFGLEGSRVRGGKSPDFELEQEGEEREASVSFLGT